MTQKVFLFGGSGFLGSYVVEELIRRKFKAVVIDIVRSEYVKNCDYIECDILDFSHVENIIKEQTPDIVINFAGYANLDSAIVHPIECINLNVMGNLNLLEACREKGIKLFIYASSAYAMNDKGSFYGISKLASEKLIEEYEKGYGLKYTIIRYGSVYSDRKSDNNYIYNLILNAIKSGEIVHEGDGEEVREYIHAADAAKLTVDLINNEEYVNSHLILTGVERMKRIELFQMIAEIINDKITIKLTGNGYKHHYKMTPYQFQPTMSKKLIANPYVDIGQGIVKIIKNIYKENLMLLESLMFL